MNDPFNPDGGEFAKNIRAITGLDDTELRSSMEKFGWSPEFPALVDENDVVLVGHRRLKIAEELGIKPVIKKLTIGRGNEADAERLKLALISNIGHKPMSKDDRKRIAEHLYGSRQWRMDKIGEALNVSTRQISKDLGGFEPSSKPSRPKGGRPKSTKPKRAVAPTLKKARAIVRPIIESGDPVHVADLEAKHGISNNVFSNAAAMERQAFEERMAEEVDIAASLSGSQKQKYEAAIRQMRKKMDAELERYKYQANTDAANHMDQWLEETLLPKLRIEQEEAKDIIESRKGIMDKTTFNRIRRCLHTDSRLSVTPKILNEAFTSFMALEKRLLKQADSPTEFAPIPKNRKEWEALRRKKRPRKTNERGEVIQFPGKAS